MIARSIYCALFIIIQSGMCSAQEVFHRSYGGTGDDYGRAVDICASGGYIIAGSTNSFINPSTDVYLLRIDESGEFMWGKNIGEPNFIEWGIDVAEDAEGNFYVAGYTNNSGGNSYDGMLLKTDGDGNLLWTKTFGGTDWDFFNGMEMDAAGNIYLAGSATTDDGQKGWVIKTDPEGIIIWESYVTIPGTTAIHGISMCTDGTLAFVGALSSFDPIGKTIIAGLVEPDGNIVWNESFPDLGDAEANGCVCDENDNMIRMIGSAFDVPTDAISHIKLAGVDSQNGVQMWTITYGGTLENTGKAITKKLNGNLIITGARSEAGYGMLDAYLSEVSPEGEFLGNSFGFILGSEQNEILQDIKITPDGGYITVGETNGFGNNYQLYVIKVGLNNEVDATNTDYLDITTSTSDKLSKANIKIFPNPATTFLNIQTDGSPMPEKLLLFDIYGKIVSSLHINSYGKVNLPQHIPSGLYTVVLHSSNDRYISKLVIKKSAN